MNANPPLAAAKLQDVLSDHRNPLRDRQLDGIIAARRAAESAIGLAMVTSAIPGMEVFYLEGEVVVVGS